jgi:hypothetical protein
LGVGWISQPEPFQRCASASKLPGLGWENPTAVHALARVQDTPNRPPASAPAGVGVGWIDQPPAAAAPAAHADHSAATNVIDQEPLAYRILRQAQRTATRQPPSACTSAC